MADTIRKQILDSLVAHLEGEPWIVSGGVGINPGKHNYDEHEIPGISVIVGEEQGAINKYTKQDCTVSVQFTYVGLLSDQPETPFDTIEDIRGKMIKSVATATLGGLSKKNEYAGGSIDYPTEKDSTHKVTVLFNISYVTLKNDPYLQTAAS